MNNSSNKRVGLAQDCPISNVVPIPESFPIGHIHVTMICLGVRALRTFPEFDDIASCSADLQNLLPIHFFLFLNVSEQMNITLMNRDSTRAIFLLDNKV